ncbi:MAG: DUF5663 domain-containing protein [bacterium]|nr:DUF5663 domain-containing protein [bacterium]
MFKLDNEFLTSLGLGSLPVDEKNKLLQHIYERLEMNVGMRLAEKMTDQQLDEFEGFIDRNDESGALKWLETNFPNYKQVVAEELDKLKNEVSQAAPQIMAAAQSAPAQPEQSTTQQPQAGQFAPSPQQQPGVPQPAYPGPNPSYQPQVPQPGVGQSGFEQMATPQSPMQQPYPPQPQQAIQDPYQQQPAPQPSSPSDPTHQGQQPPAGPPQQQ